MCRPGGRGGATVGALCFSLHPSPQTYDRPAPARLRGAPEVPPGSLCYPLVSPSADMADAPVLDPADPDLRQRIETTLDSIRPYMMADGGSVRLQNVTDDMVVELELLGACGTCPMSMMTLRAGIEQAIKRAVPEITRVEAVAPAA